MWAGGVRITRREQCPINLFLAGYTYSRGAEELVLPLEKIVMAPACLVETQTPGMGFWGNYYL